MLAAEQVGENGKGKDGLVGYLRHIARKDVKAFANLMGKIIPTQVVGPNEGPIQVDLADVREIILSRIAGIAARSA